ncbi:MAG: ECF transporter S component [Bacteroidia bacterium]|nr:ECF transporter S component [Bacteroidia bacterium]
MQNKLVRSIVFDAMFLAIIVIMTAVPNVGLIQIGPISFTLLHIPVLIGAAIFGWKRGLLYGIFFGVATLIKAISYPGTIDFLFVNPLISVLPRAVFGLVSGLLFSLVRKMPKFYQKGIHITVASFVLTLFHTFIVLTMLWAIYHQELDAFLNTTTTWAGLALAGLIGTGALIEAGIAAIVIPTISLLIFNKYPHLAAKKEDIHE